ncbi:MULTISPECIES: nucleoside 2-deoxyribosyltransferase [Burkholderiaceae]|uniref:nucleoside 2-deoxyribosyltransferase n=2 Tax=Burkholderiales TaxID=80840 RepID=UPI0009EB5822
MVVAHLNNFRGLGEPNCGTAVSIGFAAALGKPTWAYQSGARALVEQIAATSDPPSSLPMSARGYVLEHSGLNVNPMVASSAGFVVGGPGDCLREIKKFSNGGSHFDYGVCKRSFVYIG